VSHVPDEYASYLKIHISLKIMKAIYKAQYSITVTHINWVLRKINFNELKGTIFDSRIKEGFI
jgi:hypothetical protein